jgi:hypothetical protein
MTVEWKIAGGDQRPIFCKGAPLAESGNFFHFGRTQVREGNPVR